MVRYAESVAQNMEGYQMITTHTCCCFKRVVETLTDCPEQGSESLPGATGNRAVLGGLLTLAGYVVHYVADGGFMVVRSDWGMSKHCNDIYELQAFAQKVGAKP